jgi:GNAT superfamily N-acetyltransferase
MRDNINVRLAKIDDLPSILLLNVSEYYKELSIWQTHDQRKRWELASWWGDIDLLNWHFQVLKSSNGGILIAYIGEKIIGELDYVISQDFDQGTSIKRYHIIWVLVDNDYRRKGIAQLMINELRLISQGIPIWVEAEDQRTEKLYNTLGQKKLILTNWIVKNKLNYVTNPSIPYEINSINYVELMNFIQNGEWMVLFGNYYAPEFDINQMIYAEEVHEYIWGDLPPADIIEYKLENIHVIAVITQYPRVLVKSGYNIPGIVDILKEVLIRIHDVGFEEIYIQYYFDERIEKIFAELDLIPQGNKDTVYEL